MCFAMYTVWKLKTDNPSGYFAWLLKKEFHSTFKYCYVKNVSGSTLMRETLVQSHEIEPY